MLTFLFFLSRGDDNVSFQLVNVICLFFYNHGMYIFISLVFFSSSVITFSLLHIYETKSGFTLIYYYYMFFLSFDVRLISLLMLMSMFLYKFAFVIH